MLGRNELICTDLRLDVLNALGGFAEERQMDSSGCLATCTALAQCCRGYVKQLGLLVNAAWHVVKDVGEVREMCGVWFSKHHTTFERPLCKLERLKAEQLFLQTSD